MEKKKWWDSVVESVFISDSNNMKLHFELCGGADEGQFPHIGPINVSDLTKIGLQYFLNTIWWFRTYW